MRFSILGDGPTGRWFLKVRRPAGRVKNRVRRRGSASLIASSKTWRRGSMQPGSRPRQARRRSSKLVSVCVEFARLGLLQCGDERPVHRGWVAGRRRTSRRSGHPGHRRFDEECARARWRALTRRRKARVEVAHEVELMGRHRPATAAPFCYDRRRIARPIRSAASLTASGG
jgi:hypothetical protein